MHLRHIFCCYMYVFSLRVTLTRVRVTHLTHTRGNYSLKMADTTENNFAEEVSKLLCPLVEPSYFLKLRESL